MAAVHRLKTGKISEAVRERSVDKRLAGVQRSPGSGAMESGEMRVMQDAVILNRFLEVTPAPAGALIRLAFCRMQNRFAACGALMKTIAVSLLLPENTAEEVLRGLMDELAVLCREYDITVSDVHAEVSAAARQPVVGLTGIGFMKGAFREEERPAAGGRSGEPADRRAALSFGERQRPCGTAQEAAGRSDEQRLAVFMTKYAGSAGGGQLAALAGADAFPEKGCPQGGRCFSEAFLTSARTGIAAEQLLSLREAALLRDLAGSFPLYLRAMGYGGVCTALWQLAGELRCGITADRKKIPIRQETVELANFYQIDPYRMDSTGCLLGAAPRVWAESAVRHLEENGIPARVIGTLTDSGDRLLINDGEIQYLNMPQGDALEELCPYAFGGGEEYGGEHV